MRIAQDFVGVRRFDERRRTVVAGDVGMIAPGELAVRALDFVSACARRYALDLVLGAHLGQGLGLDRAMSPNDRATC
jgi:hypothetical protein